MPATLTVSSLAETHSLALDASGKGEATYILTNSSPKPVQGRAIVVPQDPARRDWFRIVGNRERSFRGGEAQQFKIEVAVPPEAPAGTYGFRLDAVNVANPDEDFSEGQTLSFAWQPAPVPKPPPKPKWIIPAIIAGCALVLVLGLFFMLRDTRVAVPDVLGKTRTEAESALKAAGLKPSQTPSVGSDASKNPDTVIGLSAQQDGKASKLEAGAKVSQGTEVTLTLNKRAVVVNPVPVPINVIRVPTGAGIDLLRLKDEVAAKASLKVASPVVKQSLDRK
jgi:hypothetical protein